MRSVRYLYTLRVSFDTVLPTKPRISIGKPAHIDRQINCLTNYLGGMQIRYQKNVTGHEGAELDPQDSHTIANESIATIL